MWTLLAQMEPAGPSRFQQTFDKLARTPLSQVLIFVAVLSVLRLIIAPYIAKTPPHRRSGAFGFIRFSNELLDAIIYAGVVVFMIVRPFGVQTFTIPTESMVPELQVNDFIIANKAVLRYSEPKHGDILVFKPPKYALDATQGEVDYIKRLIGVPGDTIEVRDGSLYRNGEKVNEPYISQPFIENDWKLVKYEGDYEPWKGRFIPVTIPTDFRGFRVPNYLTAVSREFAVGADESRADWNEKSMPHWKEYPHEFTAAEVERANELLALPPAAIPPGFLLMMGDNRNRSYDGRAWGLIPRDAVVGRSEVIWFPFRRWGKTISQSGTTAN